MVALPSTGWAGQHASDLARASIEDLLSVRIVSVDRKEQRAEDAAAAVYVITQDDIRRSGFTALADVFRLVPGMDVARANSNKWAVSVRGFNDVFANKLLVLIDGRSIYNSVFSGVYWDFEDLVLDDIDRIEVVRGPGGTAWGANAVNGVINIVTKSAADTQGTLVSFASGTAEHDKSTVRYGGRAVGMTYRVYSQWGGRQGGLTDRGITAADDWRTWSTGMRADWSHGLDTFMVQSAYQQERAFPLWTGSASPTPGSELPIDQPDNTHETVWLGRWTRQFDQGDSLQVQSFVTLRNEQSATLDSDERVVDVDAQYHARMTGRHDVVAGGGYRDSDFNSAGTYFLNFDRTRDRLANFFVQDGIAITRHVTLTVGSKFEHSSIVGWGLLPSASATWTVSPTQRLWAAVSSSRRTPSTLELSARINYASLPGPGMPLVLRVIGNPDFRSERLLDTEAGYRVRLAKTASLDVSVFHGTYTDLRTVEPAGTSVEMLPAPQLVVALQYQNLLNARTVGSDVSLNWSPTVHWRLDGSYSAFRVSPQANPGSQDSSTGTFDANTPGQQWQVRSSTWIGHLEFNGSLFHVGRLEQMDVPAYTRADARVELKLNPQWSLVAAGQNLLHASHAEFVGPATGLVSTLVPRSGRLGVSLKF